MHIDWIITYLDLLQTRNFNQTAENLGLTQSTVSHRIQKLEEVLDQRLFQRGRSGAMPTRSGELFEDHARNLQREWATAKHKLAADPANTGEIRLGIQYDVARYFAGDLIKSLRNEFPKSQIFTEIDYSNQMCQDVLKGHHDFAIIFTPTASPDLYIEEFTQLSYFMLSSSERQLEELNPETYIFPNYSPSFSAQHRSQFPHLNQCRLTSGQADAIEQFLHRLGGVSYLPAPALIDTSLQVVDRAPVFVQQVYFCCHIKNRRRNDFVKFVRILRKTIV